MPLKPPDPDIEIKQPTVAVLLFGLLREFRTAAPSFIRHVVKPNDAALFYFGPAETDAPGVGHKGRNDIFGSMINNPKSEIGRMVPVDAEGIREVYGAALRAAEFHREPQSKFAGASTDLLRPEDWLFQMNPARMFSMMFNMQGVVRLFLDHERRTGEAFDTIILTRPDLAFYGPLNTWDTKYPFVRQGELHIPSGEGFSDWGEKHTGNAPVLHYKNVATGDFVPGGRGIRFNDQILLLHRSDLERLSSIYDDLLTYMAARVPASPETVLYLHLVQRAGLTVVEHPEWLYQIHRAGARPVQNVIDTPEIMFVDRRHPAAVAARSKRPLISLLRDAKFLVRAIMWRMRR